LEPESLVEVFLGDPAGGDDHRSQRPQHPPGHQPAEPNRDHRHHRQGDSRLHQELMKLLCPLTVSLRLEPLRLGLQGREAGGDRRAVAPSWGRDLGAGDVEDIAAGMAHEQVGDPQQRSARDHEQAAVQQRQPQAYRPSRQARRVGEFGKSTHPLTPGGRSWRGVAMPRRHRGLAADNGQAPGSPIRGYNEITAPVGALLPPRS
jgi:hypothetical protein